MWIWITRGGIGCVGGERHKEEEIKERGMRCDKIETMGHNEVGG